MVDVFKNIEKLAYEFKKDFFDRTRSIEDGSHEFDTEIAFGGQWVIINWSFWQDTTTLNNGSRINPDDVEVSEDVIINYVIIDEDGTEINADDLNKLREILI